MGNSELISKHLVGTDTEKARREELLRALLDAFDRDGAAAVTTELTTRLAKFQSDFDEKLQALSRCLS
jgi:hypothetical protein